MIRRILSLFRNRTPKDAQEIFIDRGPAYMRVWTRNDNVCISFGASPHRRILFSRKAAGELARILAEV